MLKLYMMRALYRITSAKKVLTLQGDELKQYILSNYRNGQTSAPSNRLKKKMHFSEESILGSPCYVASSKHRSGKKAVIYLHGGAYFSEALSFQWNFIHKMTESTGAKFYLLDYPLCPENSAEGTFDMVLETYKKLLKKYAPENIVLMGDSAGGAIALSTAMLFRDMGIPQPGHVILISPSVNFTDKISPKEKKYEEYLDKRDPMLSLKAGETIMAWWRGSYSDKDYRVRPIYGNLQGLAPMKMFSGTADVLNIFARQLMRKAKKQGVSIDYYEKRGMIHDWVLMGLWESRKYEEIIAGVLR